MKKPNITKGEWYISSSAKRMIGSNRLDYRAYIRSDSSKCQIDLWGFGGGKGKTDKTAQAISAVPEMIDALVEAESTIRDLVYKNGLQEYCGMSNLAMENVEQNETRKSIISALEKAGVEL